MQNSRQIKQRIKTAGNISKITKAMEMVSASKMRKAQDQALSARPYAKALQASLEQLAPAVDQSLHPFFQDHGEGDDIAIVISTDKGLCGNLNGALFKKMAEWAEGKKNPKIIAIGKKLVSFAHIYDFTLQAQFTDIAETITTSEILPITSLAIDSFLAKEVRSVSLMYTDFISTLSQEPVLHRLLPIVDYESEEKGTKLVDEKDKSEYRFEPSPKEILQTLLPYYIENSVFQAFLEARASEHSARMVSMKNASENASDLVSELKLEFNKSRQAAITSELLDITTAVLGQATSH